MIHTNTMRKAAGATNANGLHTGTTGADFRTGGAINQAPDSKAPDSKVIASQIERLTLAGHAVHKGTDCDFLVCKYGLSRWCKDFAELQAFAVKLGVTP